MNDARARLLVAGALLAYAAGFALFYPSVPLVRDEVKYLEQTQAFARGDLCYDQPDVFTGEPHCARPANYLPGTALLGVPFVQAFGWQGGYLPACLCLLVAVGTLAGWLRSAGRSPLFALMLLVYPSSLVFGRLAMSDAPSMALATVGLFAFWTGGPARPGRWLVAGAIAGLSLSIRETNVLVFAPLFVGALLRERGAVWPLVLGGLAASTLRPVASSVVFGDPFFTFPHGPTFSFAHVPGNLPVYAVALLLYLPAGLLAVLAYRGERRPELVATVFGVLAVYAAYGYSGGESGPAKQLLLGPRYFMPLAPLVVWACSEVFPRWWSRFLAGRSVAARARLERALPPTLTAYGAGVAVLAFAVHAGVAAYTAPQLRTQRAFYEHTQDGAVVVFNKKAARKFVNRLYGRRVFVQRDKVDEAGLATLLRERDEFYVALVDRTGSDLLAEDADRNARFVERVARQARLETLYEAPGGPGETVHVYRARSLAERR